MNRRDLLKSLAAFSVLAGTSLGKTNSFENKKIIKPKRLMQGDTVGVIAPASAAEEDEFTKAVQNLEGMGFKVKIGKNARNQNGYLAGTDRERLEDLHWAFGDAEIKAVWCLRGGYGTSRFLPEINYELIKKNPKILIGYSDITALHLAIHQNTGLVTFHGPVASSTYSDYAKTHCLNVLMNPTAPYKVEISADNKAKESEVYKTEVVTKGKTRGRLIGGNLSLIAALTGTPFALKETKGKILFIEDVNEAPYRVDRMLTQLRQSVDLRSLAGIACGIFTDNSSRRQNPETQPTPPTAPQPRQTTMIDVIKDRLGNLGIPVIYGLSFGHIRDQFTLPIGIEAELDTENATMTFWETGVV